MMSSTPAAGSAPGTGADHGGVVELRVAQPPGPGEQLGHRRAVLGARRRGVVGEAAGADAGAGEPGRAGSSAVSMTPTGSRAGQPLAGQPSSESA